MNITGCRSLQKRIDLKKFCEKDICASYEQEIFPNLQYTFADNQKVKGIVSKSGRIIITGVKSYQQLLTYLNELENKIESI